MFVSITLLSHNSSTNLAESYAMSPALSYQAEAIGSFLHIKSRAVEVALTECTTYLQFLTDGEGLLRTYYLQFPDASALASL